MAILGGDRRRRDAIRRYLAHPARRRNRTDGSLAVLSMTFTSAREHRVPHLQPGDLGGAPDHGAAATISLSGFAASADLMVAVGTESHPLRPGPPETTAHVWTSADGRTWASIQPPDVDGTLTDVTWDATRGTSSPSGPPRTSCASRLAHDDGRQWSSISLGGAIPMQRVVAADGLIVATGVTGSPFESMGETIVWSSHDGVTWSYGLILDNEVLHHCGGHAIVGAHRREPGAGRG